MNRLLSAALFYDEPEALEVGLETGFSPLSEPISAVSPPLLLAGHSFKILLPPIVSVDPCPAVCSFRRSGCAIGCQVLLKFLAYETVEPNPTSSGEARPFFQSQTRIRSECPEGQPT